MKAADGFADSPLFRAHGKSILLVPKGLGWSHRRAFARAESTAGAKLIAHALNAQLNDLEHIAARREMRNFLDQLRKEHHDAPLSNN